MDDEGNKITERMLTELEQRLYTEYTQAEREVREKLLEHFEQYAKNYREWQRKVESGEKTKRQFQNWVNREMARSARWEALKTQLARDLYNVDKIALSITRGYMPEIYAINHNFGIYQIEQSANILTSLTLYSRETVERLLRDDPEMLPTPGKKVREAIAEGRAVRWNRQRLQSVMTQQVLTGESIPKMATRLAKEVGDSNMKAAVRNARTMATSAQNAGRYSAYEDAEKSGVDLTIEWQAALDQRTRHSHRMLHGQRRNVGEPFEVDGIEILYPAQLGGKSSDIPQSMIWNCRCTLLAWVKGFEGETVKSAKRMNGMSFEEWQQGGRGAGKSSIGAPAVRKPVPVAKPSSPAGGNGVGNIKGLTDEFKRGMSDALDSSSSGDLKKAFSAHGSNLLCYDNKYNKTAHFMPFRGIAFNEQKDKVGNSFKKPFGVAFHEFGHHIDFLKGAGSNYASVEKRHKSESLRDVLYREFDAYKLSLGTRSRKEAVAIMKQNIRTEHIPPSEIADLSDIVEGITKVGYPFGYGHGVSYHQRQGATEKEFFAEVCTALAVNAGSLSRIQTIFPEAVEFVKMILRGDL